MKSIYKIGSKMALLIGFPIGLLFSWMALTFSLFSPINVSVAISGGKFLWFPGCIVTPLVFVYLLWSGGRRIASDLSLNKSILSTSFRFSLYVNSFIFLVIVALWVIGAFHFQETYITATVFMCSLVVGCYLLAVFFTTFTIGWLIVYVIKEKMKWIRNEVSESGKAE